MKHSLRSPGIVLLACVSCSFLIFYYYTVPVIGFALFIGLAVFLILIPGHLIVAWALPDLSKKEKIVLANAVGTGMLCYGTWIANALLRRPYDLVPCLLLLAAGAYIAVAAIGYRRSIDRKVIGDLLRSPEFAAASLVFLTTLLVSRAFLLQGSFAEGKMAFYGTTGIEGMWHVGNIAYLTQGAAFADIRQNENPIAYHHLTYLPAALTSRYFGIEPVTLHFKIVPLYNLFFCFYSAYVLFRSLRVPRSWSVAGCLLVAVLDDLAVAKIVTAWTGIEWLSWTYMGPRITNGFISGPSYTVGFMYFCSIAILLNRAAGQRFSVYGVTAFLLGSMIGFKANLWLVMGLTVFLLAVYRTAVLREKGFMIFGLGSLAISLPFLLWIRSVGATGFELHLGYFPGASQLGGWFEGITGNSLPVSILVLWPAYLAIELGPRLVSLTNLRKDLMEHALQFIWINAIAGILLALLIVPESDPYNTMYFHRFGSMCLTFLMVRSMMQLKAKKALYFLVPVVLLYSAGGLYNYARPRTLPDLSISQSDYELLRTLNRNGDPPRRLLSESYSLSPASQDEKHWHFTALSGLVALSEGAAFSPIARADSLRLREVRSDIRTFFMSDDTAVCRGILTKWNADVVLCDGRTPLAQPPHNLAVVDSSENLIAYRFFADR